VHKSILIFIIILGLYLQSAFATYMPIAWMNDPDKETSVRIVKGRHQILVDLQDLAERLDISWKQDISKQRIRLDMPVQNLIFSVGSPFVLAGNDLKQMPLPIVLYDDRFFAAIEPLISLLIEYYPGELLFDPNGPRLLVTPPRHDLFGLRYDVQPGRTRVIIPAGRPLKYVSNTLPDGSIELFFPGSRIDIKAFASKSKAGLIVKLRAEQTVIGAKVIITPDGSVSSSSVEQVKDPPLYCVEFISKTAGGLDSKAQRRLEEDKNAWALDVVVIDPGHGGKDPGAIGKTKIYEKDIVLDVGLRLKKALNDKGVKTVMTRDNDKLIPLNARGRIANKCGGKVFISLHANSCPNRKAHGIETYFLAPTKTDRAMKVAMLENSVIKYEETQDQYQELTEENFILLTMAQANFVKESERLAAIVQDRVCQGLSLRDRGVDQAGFYVLIGASMPSILFEMGFLSNREEEKRMRSKDFRQKMADRLCVAVLDFLKGAQK